MVVVHCIPVRFVKATYFVNNSLPNEGTWRSQSNSVSPMSPALNQVATICITCLLSGLDQVVITDNVTISRDYPYVCISFKFRRNKCEGFREIIIIIANNTDCVTCRHLQTLVQGARNSAVLFGLPFNMRVPFGVGFEKRDRPIE